MKEYYVLSLKWSQGKNNFVWFKPDDCGYTEDINKAGIYSEERIMSRKAYYFNRNCQVAIPKEIVDNLLNSKVIPTLDENFEDMNLRQLIRTLPEY